MKYVVFWDVRRRHSPLYECSLLCVISLLLISVKQVLPHTLPIITVQGLKEFTYRTIIGVDILARSYMFDIEVFDFRSLLTQRNP
jgi:hypothetical protein